tara:strand:+ start:1041 stop:1334 length:294 start_codon:yes stop_codon:yes gene_type:complete
MDTTFDINNIDEERQGQPATHAQVRAISLKFSKLKSGKINWERQKRIYGCLYSLIKQGKLSFKQAHIMLSKTKKFPEKYETLIDSYLEANKEVELPK